MIFLRKMNVFNILLLISLELFAPSSSYNFTCQNEDLENEIGATNFLNNPWPNGIVHYVFHSSLTNSDKGHVYRAFEEYHTKTCIRFVPRNGEPDYVSIENDPKTCGLAHVGRIGGYQFAKFGGGCINAGTMTHELGHTLGFRHEQNRPDKSQYISTPCRKGNFNENMSSLKNIVKVEGVGGQSKNLNTLDLYYDYTSALHYGCNSCLVPTKPGVGIKDCGNASPTSLLSVLDVEKFNIFYNCPGCMSYRFKPLNKISGDRMVVGGHGLDGQTQHICRVLHNGDIMPGTGFVGGSNCYVAQYGLEHAYHNTGEFLTNPKNANILWRPISDFANKVPGHALQGGRTKNGSPLYVGRCTFNRDGKKALQVGKIEAHMPDRVFIPFYGKEIACVGNFEILVCEETKPVRIISSDKLVLESPSGVSEGKKVTLWDKNDDKWQQWMIDGLYSPGEISSIIGKPVTIKNLDQDGGRIKVLDEDVGSKIVAVWGDVGALNQKWIFREAQYKTYHIVNAETKRCLYANGRHNQIETKENCGIYDPKALWNIY